MDDYSLRCPECDTAVTESRVQLDHPPTQEDLERVHCGNCGASFDLQEAQLAVARRIAESHRG